MKVFLCESVIVDGEVWYRWWFVLCSEDWCDGLLVIICSVVECCGECIIIVRVKWLKVVLIVD